MAASCPDGYAEVGRCRSSCVTSGLGRWTTAAATRKAPSSPAMTVATKTTGRQRRVTARNTTQVASATMRIAWVAPSVLKISLQWVRPGVRWAANQCGIVRSPSTLPLPALVTSSPIPTMMPRISTQATRTPAAIRP